MAAPLPSRPPLADDARAFGRERGPIVAAFVSLPAGVPAQANETRLRHVAEALADRMRSLSLDRAFRERVTRELAPFFADPSPCPPGIEARVALLARGRSACFGLPFPAEGAVVAGSTPVRTLLRAAQAAAPYRVLAFSLNAVRVASGDVRGLDVEAHPDLPTGLVDALGSEIEGAGLQLHSTARGGRHPVYHGHDDASAGRELDRERFHRVLGSALVRGFAKSELPIVVVADRTHRDLVSSLADRLPVAGAVEGSPDHWSERELHERAFPLAVAAYRDRRAARRQELERARGRGRVCLHVDACVRAVCEGGIRRLWVPDGPGARGGIDVASSRPCAPFGDEALLDALACEALRQGADVECLEPGQAALSDAELAAERW